MVNQNTLDKINNLKDRGRNTASQVRNILTDILTDSSTTLSGRTIMFSDAQTIEVPIDKTLTSQLINDSGYITGSTTTLSGRTITFSDLQTIEVPSGTTFTSELINNGYDGVNPYITETSLYNDNVVIDGSYYHISGYTYHAQADKYIIDNILYFGPVSGTVTLAEADPALDRIDVIIITSGGTFESITGMPNSNPSKPDVNSELEVELTFILVKANTTAPANIINNVIYNENNQRPTEWDTSTPSAPRVILNSTEDAQIGIRSIKFDSATKTDYVDFDNIAFDGTDISNVIFRIKLKNAVSHALAIRLYNTVGPDGINVSITTGQYGFDRTSLDVWQTIVIPSTVLGISGKYFNKIRIQNRRAGAIFFLDNIIVQSGTEMVTSQPVITNTSELINDGADGINPFITALDLTGSTGGAFEVIDEGNGDGIVRTDRVTANYGPIGENAFDNSYSSSVSTSYGATGDYSTAWGINTKAEGNQSTASGYYTYASGNTSNAWGYLTIASGNNSTAFGGYGVTASGYNSTAWGSGTIASGRNSTASGDYSIASGNNSTAFGSQIQAYSWNETAIGSYGIDAGSGNANLWVGTDRIFSVGNGFYKYTLPAGPVRQNALTILKKGDVIADSLTQGMIASGDSRMLITREYADANYSGGSGGAGAFEIVDEGNGLGIIRSGRNAANYDPIGYNAFDNSYSSYSGYGYGATGDLSTASGYNSTASGKYSTASGYKTTASGLHAVASGGNTTASGYGSTASGFYSTASGYFANASGIFNTASSYGETTIGLYSAAFSGGTPTSWIGDERLFSIGNGTASGAYREIIDRSDALVVLKKGDVIAPSLTNAIIASGDSRTLITREYADANYAGGTGSTGVTKYSETFGNGVITGFTINHAMGTEDISITIKKISNGAIVYPDIFISDGDNVDLNFATAPTSNEYRVTIIG